MEEKEIFVNDLKINYKIAGQGQPILILHGWGSNSDQWQKVGEIVSQKGFKIIIPDLPGFGKSQEPKTVWNLDDYCNFLEDFRKFLGLKKFYLLGHSFGGGLAVKFSLKFPERIEKLFLVAAACIRKKTMKKKILIITSKILNFFSFLPFYSLARKIFYKIFVGSSDYLKTKGVIKESFIKIVNEDLSKILTSIKVPTVIIWGKKDNMTLLDDAYFMKQKIKNSKLIIIPEGNHALEQNMPEILAQKILENL